MKKGTPNRNRKRVRGKRSRIRIRIEKEKKQRQIANHEISEPNKNIDNSVLAEIKEELTEDHQSEQEFQTCSKEVKMSYQEPSIINLLKFKDISLKCKHCDAFFLTQSNLEKHHDSAHPKLCLICGLDFSSEGKERHVKQYHSEISLKCPSCKNIYLGQTAFLDHARNCNKSCGPGIKPAISIQAVSSLKTKTPQLPVSKNKVTDQLVEGGRKKLVNVSPTTKISRKRVLTVGEGDFRKQIQNILQPAQTPPPGNVIVVDVADLRKNVCNVVQLFSSVKPTAQLGSVSSQPNANSQGQFNVTSDLISAAKPMKLFKTSSSETKNEPGKKVLQVEDLEFRKVIKDILPVPTGNSETASAVRKSSRTSAKRKLIETDSDILIFEPSKPLKKVDNKSLSQSFKKTTQSVSFSKVGWNPRMTTGGSLLKRSQESRPSLTPAAKSSLTKKGCSVKTAVGIKKVLTAKKPRVKEARVVLQRLSDDIVKQCLRDGFFRLQPVQKTIVVEVPKKVLQNMQSKLLPKGSLQKVETNSPIKIILPQNFVSSLQSKTVTEKASPSTIAQPVLAPLKTYSGIAPTVLKWKAEMSKVFPAPLADQSNTQFIPMPFSSPSTFKPTTVRAKPSVSPQIITSNQKKGFLPTPNSPAILKPSGKKKVLQPSSSTAAIKPTTSPPVVIVLSDNDSMEGSPPKNQLAVAKSAVSFQSEQYVPNKTPQKVLAFPKLIDSAVDKCYSISRDAPQTNKLVPKKRASQLSPHTTDSPVVISLSDSDIPEKSPPVKTEKEVLVKKMLIKLDEKERLKKEKYVEKKTSKFVEKNLRQLKQLQKLLSKRKPPTTKKLELLFQEVSNLFMLNQQPVTKVLSRNGFRPLLDKCNLDLYKTEIAENKVLSNSFKRYSTSSSVSSAKDTKKIKIAPMGDPFIDMEMITEEKYLLECPCNKPNCSH